MMVRPLRPAEVGEHVAVNVARRNGNRESWRILPVTAVNEDGMITEVGIDGLEIPLRDVTDGQWFLFVRDTFKDGGAAFSLAQMRDWKTDNELRQHLLPFIRDDYPVWIEEVASARHAALHTKRIAGTVLDKRETP